jgi:hypothetical protein
MSALNALRLSMITPGTLVLVDSTVNIDAASTVVNSNTTILFIPAGKTGSVLVQKGVGVVQNLLQGAGRTLRSFLFILKKFEGFFRAFEGTVVQNYIRENGTRIHATSTEERQGPTGPAR